MAFAQRDVTSLRSRDWTDGDDALARIEASRWRELWLRLRQGYLAFERDGRPPRVGVRAKRYTID